jgi:hypothetical protein
MTTASLLLTAAIFGADPSATVSRLDAALVDRWQADKVAPAKSADDAIFLRRAWLDLAGQVPPVSAARAFLDDPRTDKRQRLIEALLKSDDFADHWARLWTKRLTGRRAVAQDGYDNRVLNAYLHDALSKEQSYRDIVRDLLTGSGLQDASGPANFLLRYNAKPADLAGAVGKQFMGVTIHCAQCHDHVFAAWKKDDFWALAAYFGRLRKVNADDGDVAGVMELRKGDLQVPDSAGKPDKDGKPAMKVVVPKAPGATAPATGSPRQALASWLTADDNPYFARQTVNQVWSELFGSPLVLSLDDLPAALSSPGGPALELLANDFRDHGYSLKRLVRVIMSSKAYSLSSSPTEARTAALQSKAFARFSMRPLSADQLYQSIAQATGHGVEAPPSPESPLTLQRTLVLINGDFLHQAAQTGAKHVVAAVGRRDAAAQIEWMFLATLSRRPTAEESAAMLRLVQEGKALSGVEDVLWALVNSAEFGTNH